MATNKEIKVELTWEMIPIEITTTKEHNCYSCKRQIPIGSYAIRSHVVASVKDGIYGHPHNFYHVECWEKMHDRS
jgi:hypothetical protein